MIGKKTDNHSLKTKLDLRRHFLDRYHVDSSPRIFDCCQGSGLLWGMLKKEYSVASYWGVDVKSKKGRLKIDSARVLDQSGWNFDVIDVDTYGSPWAHWLAILRYAPHDLTVFLTVGLIRMSGGGQLDRHQKEILGISTLNVPPAIQGKLHAVSAEYLLAESKKHDITIQECTEAMSDGNARYLGLRLKKTNGPSAASTRAVLTSPPMKEARHG